MHLLEINRTRDVSLIDLLQIYITTSTTMSYQNSPDMFLMDLGDGMDDIAMNLSPEEPPDIANLTPSQQSDTPVLLPMFGLLQVFTMFQLLLSIVQQTVTPFFLLNVVTNHPR